MGPTSCWQLLLFSAATPWHGRRMGLCYKARSRRPYLMACFWSEVTTAAGHISVVSSLTKSTSSYMNVIHEGIAHLFRKIQSEGVTWMPQVSAMAASPSRPSRVLRSTWLRVCCVEWMPLIPFWRQGSLQGLHASCCLLQCPNKQMAPCTEYAEEATLLWLLCYKQLSLRGWRGVRGNPKISKVCGNVWSK